MARVPLYQKAETEMLRRIRSGEWEEGRRLPNEFILADEFGVSQGTMRRALITLEQMGHLNRKPGRGTLVSRPEKAPATGAVSGPGFDRLTRMDGGALSPESFRGKVKSRRAEDEEETLFGAVRLSVLERTLKLDGNRFALDEVALPETLAAGLTEDGPEDLPGLLSGLGLAPARIEDRVTARLCTMGESVALSVDRNTALLCLTRVARDAGGQALARQTLLMAEGRAAYSVPLNA